MQRLGGSRATEPNANRPRSPAYFIYKRHYIPIYIFTRTHTYLTFFPFHIVYSPYVRRVSRVCALPPFEPNQTNAPLFYLRVFRKGEAFIPFLSTIRSVVERYAPNTGPWNISFRFMSYIFRHYVFSGGWFLSIYYLIPRFSFRYCILRILTVKRKCSFT